ncbi:MAG: sulfite exporter TauE/SafE family protein [Pseudomonadota bacterium]
MDGVLLVAALAAGFFGQAHCAAMCGPLVTLFETGGPRGMNNPWWRRSGYQAGRLLTYAALGVTIGALGHAISIAVEATLATVALRLAAALAVLIAGLALAGVPAPLAALEGPGRWAWQRVAPVARHVLPLSSPERALAAGALWGLLPCGMVYAALAMAAASGSAANGAAVMLAFGLGTLPVTVAIGAGAGWQPSEPRQRRLVGQMLVAVAAFSIGLQLAPAFAAPTGGDWQSALAALCQH